MFITELLFPVLVLGILALFLGAILSVIGKFFAVPQNEMTLAVRSVLPGINCGACGYPGCDGYSKAVVEGLAKTTACTVGGDELSQQIAEVMGVEKKTAAKVTAFVKCAGGIKQNESRYHYEGMEDCNALSQMAGGGPKSCKYGCLGLGSCARACPFDAIDMVEGVAVVNSTKCVACTLCAKICPKELIEIIPDNSKIRVVCNSKDKGAVVRKNCSIGCIGCKMCVKVCPCDAVFVNDNLAHIDYEKCTLCGQCAQKCPTKSICGAPKWQ